MNHWAFITAAYVVTLGGTIGLVLVSFVAMRKSESGAEKADR